MTASVQETNQKTHKRLKYMHTFYMDKTKLSCLHKKCLYFNLSSVSIKEEEELIQRQTRDEFETMN